MTSFQILGNEVIFVFIVCQVNAATADWGVQLDEKRGYLSADSETMLPVCALISWTSFSARKSIYLGAMSP